MTSGDSSPGDSRPQEAKPTSLDHSLDPAEAGDPADLRAGEVILESLSSGVITPEEIAWITAHQGEFSREEEAAALKLGRLLDEGQIQLGCRRPN